MLSSLLSFAPGPRMLRLLHASSETLLTSRAGDAVEASPLIAAEVLRQAHAALANPPRTHAPNTHVLLLHHLPSRWLLPPSSCCAKCALPLPTPKTRAPSARALLSLPG